jgi:hypothetical protein
LEHETFFQMGAVQNVSQEHESHHLKYVLPFSPHDFHTTQSDSFAFHDDDFSYCYPYLSPQGQNEYAINVITKELDYLTWNEAFTCLSDQTLPDRLRAKYCDLIISKYTHSLWANNDHIRFPGAVYRSQGYLKLERDCR